MSDKLDEMIAAGAQLEAYGEGGWPCGGIITLIIAIAVAAAVLTFVGSF